jgi:heat shock protein 5
MREEDERVRQATVAKNRLENYLFGVKAQLNDEKMAAKFSAEDKEKVTEIVKNGLEWLEEHMKEEKEVYDTKFEELQEELKPLIGSVGAAPPGGEEGGAGPTDDEEPIEHDGL